MILAVSEPTVPKVGVELNNATADASLLPIDVVYTWVNGSDPRQIEGCAFDGWWNKVISKDRGYLPQMALGANTAW